MACCVRHGLSCEARLLYACTLCRDDGLSLVFGDVGSIPLKNLLIDLVCVDAHTRMYIYIYMYIV